MHLAEDRVAWRGAWVGAVLLTLIVAAVVSWGPKFARAIDRQWLGEGVKDWVGRWYWQESWEGLPRLPTGLDYRWSIDRGGPLRVAHALGGASTQTQNTWAAQTASLAAGARVLEVDVWLDEAGRLRCHHGPERPAPYRDGDCLLGGVIERSRDAGAYVLIDIKTEFQATAARVLEVSAALDGDARLVLQLYRPEDYMAFVSWIRKRRLPGPALTAYRSHRSLDHLAERAVALGVGVLVAPLERLDALSKRHRGLRLLTHPVHDCEAMRSAQRFDIDGWFLPLDLIKGGDAACGR